MTSSWTAVKNALNWALWFGGALAFLSFGIKGSLDLFMTGHYQAGYYLSLSLRGLIGAVILLGVLGQFQRLWRYVQHRQH